jgi:phage-related protein
MARPLSEGERPLDWVGSSKRIFLGFPDSVKDEMGNALGLAQFGGKHPSAKPWKGQGPGVFELVEDHDLNTYRAVYTVRFKEVVYVTARLSKEVAHRDQNSAARCRPSRSAVEDRTTGL